MHATAAKPKNSAPAQPPALPWPSVVAALLAGIGGLALVSWVGTHLVI
ncbi:hypothetical protein [Rhodovibrio sodomensis]|nr:hypothetical protein [Rhodovibrio sodomensis]